MDFPISERNFEVISSAAVIVSNSQFFSTSNILFHTSAAVSFISLFRSKKSARLCWTFLSGVKCKRNSVYSLCNGKMLGSRSLTVLVISVSALCPIAHRKVSFMSISSCSRYCGSISLEFVIIDKSISLVILIYCTTSATRDLHRSYHVSPGLVWITSGCTSGRPSSMSGHWVVIGCLLTDRLSDFAGFPLMGRYCWSRPYVSYCVLLSVKLILTAPCCNV